MKLKKLKHMRLLNDLITSVRKILVDPILEQKPREDIHDRVWLDRIFDTENRVISDFSVTTSFTMPGDLVLTPKHIIQNVPDSGRRVKRGSHACVRIDYLRPDFIDVEITDPMGSRWFVVTSSQWEEIKVNLKDIK